jgi:polar amino acid transport system ATP-binding protein
MKLEFDNLKKQYGNQLAITPFQLVIPECQMLVLIGPSGGGKSTLLKLIGGLECPESGSIIIDDEPIIFEEKALIEHRRKLGIVFQSWNLFPHLTALENIVLSLHRVKGLSLEESETISMDLLTRFELAKHAHKKPYELSGGQCQRVALIRAVAGQPKLLLLDEPTSALDPLMTAEVLELILELKKEGRNLILSTHHLTFAKRVAECVLFLADGKVLEHGTPEDVFENPQTELAKNFMTTILSY